MSRIKYRLWDTEKEFFFEPTYEAYRGRLEEISIGPSGDLFMRTMRENIHESCFPNRFIVEQYVGLKDENGKEIYEGDIVEITYAEGVEVRGLVVFTASSFMIETDSDFWELDMYLGLVVLGNIHEVA